MEIFDIRAHVSFLTTFQSIENKDMPEGYLLVRTSSCKVGLFSLKTGELVLPPEYDSICHWGDGLLRVEKDRSHYTKYGIFSLVRGDFILPTEVWSLHRSLTNSQHVFVEVRDARHNQVGGVFSLETGVWILPLHKNLMFGKRADSYSQKSCIHNNEEFVVVHDVTSGKLGLFSLMHGMVFDVRYSHMHMNSTEGLFIATATDAKGMKECFVISSGCRLKLPPASDVRDIAPPVFILRMESGHPLYAGWNLYVADAEQACFKLSGYDHIFRHNDRYIGVSERNGSVIYDATTRERKHILGKLMLTEPVDDERWIVREGGRFGLYSLTLDDVLIPPVFESLTHIHGGLFFARWQGASQIIDLSKKEILLPLKLGTQQPVKEKKELLSEFEPTVTENLI